MNTASQDFPHHLSVLRERLLHPTDYERALHYFLEEFAGDVEFLRQSEPDEAPHLLAALGVVASKALGQPASLDQAKVFLLRAHGFHHGNAAVAGRALVFFHLAEVDTGLAALIPGVAGGVEVARFRLTAALTDPRRN